MSAPVVQSVYGIRIRTPWPIPTLPRLTGSEWDVEFVESAAENFEAAARHVAPAHLERWAQHAKLPDGSRYRRWTNLFEFLVSPDARRIEARAMPDANAEAFQAYLLVDALLFTMIRMGHEPLHATAVDTGRGVIAFGGESGLGKSTLGALFVRAGYPLVTDDMLVLVPDNDGFVAFPGPPRLKLYRDMADRIFDTGYCGVPMNPTTEKLIISMPSTDTVREANRFRAFYLLRGTDDVDAPQHPVRVLTPAEAIPQIVAITASHWTEERDRLARQFEFVTQLVRRVPIKVLSYRRDPDQLLRLRQAVIDDLASMDP